MSSPPKLLRVFYRDSEQRIKVYDGTSEASIINAIKKAFHITEDNSKIFLQDEDGDIVVLPSNIPNGLCVHVYVEPSLTPTPPATPTFRFFSGLLSSIFPPVQTGRVVGSSLLPGFKWQLVNSCKYPAPMITNNGYTIDNDRYKNPLPCPAVSTTSYDHGKLFAKINVKVSYYQSIGIVPASYNGDPHYECNESSVPMIQTIYFSSNQFENVNTFAVFIDIDNKIAKFYWLVDGKVKNEVEKVIMSGPIKIYAWTKGGEMTIMEGGSSPIPSYAS